MWATVVNRDGIVCAVWRSPASNAGDHGREAASSRRRRPTPRTRSACRRSRSRPPTSSPRRSRAAACSACRRAIPVDTGVAYGGDPANYGQGNDPMVGGRIGGVNVFGGGLALYNASGTIVGGLGVSGDSSCADHNIAWRTRHNLNLDYVPGGVSGDASRPDNIVYDITPQAGQMPGVSASGWGHAAAAPRRRRSRPACLPCDNASRKLGEGPVSRSANRDRIGSCAVRSARPDPVARACGVSRTYRWPREILVGAQSPAGILPHHDRASFSICNVARARSCGEPTWCCPCRASRESDLCQV